MMPEPRNPHHGNAATGSNKDIAFHAWERANAAWHEWLDSPEARDRVADALFEQWPDDDGQGVKVWADPRTVAQAALDALRDPA